ncbi:L,D-transpeptidase [Tomitella cavernea]|uniref:L,D-TPase catalytic domain-containing protein n=1 Tax=Tomitella cavernea TaxID=1387982 RepID=A0ABP9CY44_9ACTN
MPTQPTGPDRRRSRAGTGRGPLRRVRAGVLRTGVALAAAVGLGAGLALAGGTATAQPLFGGAPGSVELPQIPAPELPQMPPVQVPDVPLPGGQNLAGVLEQAGVPVAHGPDGATVGQSGPAPLEPANFATPQITPSEGAVVGVAQPIIINFPAPVGDRAAAERAMRVTTDNGVTGAFHWFGDSQVRWRPENLWPAHTQVTVEAGDAVRHFTIGDALIATADDATKTITVTRDGQVVRTMPTSMGKPGHETPNGIYTVGESFRTMIMDSSTYGVPIDAPEGYRLEVEYATRMSNSGIFLHAAPWSVGAQGNTNVSHGCLNVSTADAKWFFENAKPGDPVIVVNTQGGQLNGHDGLTDFSMPWGTWAG